MKSLLAAAAALILACTAIPAQAYVVEVTTHVSVDDAHDEARLRQALQGAVDEVLKDAIAFTPTIVVLTRAIVVGDRLYVRLLIADRDGERTVEDLAGGGEGADGADGAETRKDADLKI